MKIWLAKRMIHRCVDRGLPLPAWVSRLIAHDSSLDRYDRAYRSMIGRLVQDAENWVEPTSTIVPIAKLRWQSMAARQPARQVRAAVGLAIAAMLLIIAGYFTYEFAQDIGPNQLVVRQTRQPSLNLDRVVAWLEKGKAIREQSTENFGRSIDSLASSYAVQVDTLLTHQAEQAGMIIGRTVLALDSGARQERDRIASDAKVMFQYLTTVTRNGRSVILDHVE